MITFDSSTIQAARAISNRNLRDVFDQLATSGHIEAIANEQEVDRDVLRMYTGYILLGLLPSRLLVNELIEELDIIEEDALDVAREVRRRVFYPVLQELADVQERAESFYQETKEQEGGQGVAST